MREWIIEAIKAYYVEILVLMFVFMMGFGIGLTFNIALQAIAESIDAIRGKRSEKKIYKGFRGKKADHDKRIQSKAD